MPSFAFLKELTFAGAGVWTLVLIALITLIRTWAPLKKLTMDENARLFADRRADYKELRRELDIMKLRSSIVEKHSTAVDVRMGQLEFIIGMALDELDRLDGNNVVAKKAREMFGRLYPVPPINKELDELREQLDPLESPILPRRKRSER